jgi:hypothetical protein
MGRRLYDSETGRFMSVDPLYEAFSGHSPYHYAFNSPLIFRDPTGLAPEDEEKKEQIHGGEMLGFAEQVLAYIISGDIYDLLNMQGGSTGEVYCTASRITDGDNDLGGVETKGGGGGASFNYSVFDGGNSDASYEGSSQSPSEDANSSNSSNSTVKSGSNKSSPGNNGELRAASKKIKKRGRVSEAKYQRMTPEQRNAYDLNVIQDAPKFDNFKLMLEIIALTPTGQKYIAILKSSIADGNYLNYEYNSDEVSTPHTASKKRGGFHIGQSCTDENGSKEYQGSTIAVTTVITSLLSQVKLTFHEIVHVTQNYLYPNAFSYLDYGLYSYYTNPREYSRSDLLVPFEGAYNATERFMNELRAILRRKGH